MCACVCAGTVRSTQVHCDGEHTAWLGVKSRLNTHRHSKHLNSVLWCFCAVNMGCVCVVQLIRSAFKKYDTILFNILLQAGEASPL